MSHGKHFGFLLLFLPTVLALTLVGMLAIHSLAIGDHPDIVQDGITYSYDEERGRYEAWINGENVASVSGNMEVPDECGLHILDTDAAADSISVASGGMVEISTDENTEGTKTLTSSVVLEGGATLVIVGNGRLSGTVFAEQGAGMFLSSDGNKPASIETLYDADAETPMEEFAELFYVYLADQGKWVVYVEDIDPVPYSFYLELGDYDGDFELTLWRDPDCTEQLNYDDADLANGNFMVTDAWDPFSESVTVRVSLTNTGKVFQAAGIGWDEGALNFATSIMDTAVLSEDGRTITYTYETPADVDAAPHDLHLAVGYGNSGDRAILDTVNDYLYGYDADAVNRLAVELYERFITVPMFGDFGITSAGDLAARIQPSGDPYTITVTTADGSTSSRNAQVYAVSWGADREDGSAVVSTIPVYTLSGDSEFLVCTDFNRDTGRGSTFYARTANADEIAFYDTNTDQPLGCVIYSDITDYSKVAAGGNGSDLYIRTTDGLCAFEIYSRYLETTRWGTVCRILRPAETYVVLSGEGETKRYDGLGANAHSDDQVWRTGEGAQARVYIGNSAVWLEPLGAAVSGVATKSITSVTLADSSLAGGVTIGEVTGGRVRISFASNYYDQVPVTITYSDGSQENLLIIRVGLVIQYWYLFDQGEGVHSSEIRYDCKAGSCPFQYNYNAGEQILVYATYYHPTNDPTLNSGSGLFLNLRFANGTSRIISATDSAHQFNGYLAAEDDAVATTSFLIGFAPAKVRDANGVWTDDITSQVYSEGAFHATVLNAGFDDDTTYGGTQSGSGEGVYWDGQINWF
ncbi:MAG: hypothetical protein IKS07_06785 [Lachnospiraceae bacterium]|nr:hypothetical protein [Lachnospiraceae bacterium]